MDENVASKKANVTCDKTCCDAKCHLLEDYLYRQQHYGLMLNEWNYTINPITFDQLSEI
jgi:hypothetical protein